MDGGACHRNVLRRAVLRVAVRMRREIISRRYECVQQPRSRSRLAVAGRLGARSPLTVPAPAALPWLRGVALDLPPYQLVGAPRART